MRNIGNPKRAGLLISGKRFAELENSRSRATGGAGLGWISWSAPQGSVSGKRMDVEIPVVDHGWIVVVPMAIVSWKSDVRARTSSV